MRLPFFLLIAIAAGVIRLQAVQSVTTHEYNDDLTPHKVRLEDLEEDTEEQEAKYQHYERLQELHQRQQPPSPHKPIQFYTEAIPRATNSYSNHNDQRQQSQQQKQETSTTEPGQSVLPLDQIVSPLKKPTANTATTSDYETASANRYSLGISPFAYNGIEDLNDAHQPVADIITYSHDIIPYNAQQQQPAASTPGLGQGHGDGYALKPSTFVLVPPFDERPNELSDASSSQQQQYQPQLEHHHLQRIPPRPISLQGFAKPIRPIATGGGVGVQYVNSNDLTESSPSGPIEFAQGHYGQRPVIEYGSPDSASFRRPTYPHGSKSNQFAYAPERPESGSLSASAVTIPFPPSFVSITTRRPSHAYVSSPSASGSGPATAVRPLGRALYGRQFQPSAQDPVPDPFGSRQAKSLLDSYIPSWVIARMLEQQQQQRSPLGFTAYRGHANFPSPYNRFIKRNDVDRAGDGIDDATASASAPATATAEDQGSRKIVKKSLNVQATAEDDGMLMTE